MNKNKVMSSERAVQLALLDEKGYCCEQ